jgi:hypothetical protein
MIVQHLLNARKYGSSKCHSLSNFVEMRARANRLIACCITHRFARYRRVSSPTRYKRYGCGWYNAAPKAYTFLTTILYLKDPY